MFLTIILCFIIASLFILFNPYNKDSSKSQKKCKYNVIGITGRKFSGKDLSGSIISRLYGHKMRAFANPLKEACRVLFGFDDDQLYGDKKEVVDEFWKITPRTVLQKVGTDLFRDNFDKDFWIKCMERKLQKGKPCVICDIRFDNECSKIKEYGGIVIRINRKVKENEYSNHESEKNIDTLVVDYEIDNNESFEILEKKIIEILQ